MLLSDIKKQFPNPADNDDQPCSYCVLGAAIMVKRNTTPETTPSPLRFPDVIDASKYLGISITRANAVIDANDDGDFDEAWRILGQALETLNQ